MGLSKKFKRKLKIIKKLKFVDGKDKNYENEVRKKDKKTEDQVWHT